jgi:hypothetical protein
MKTFLIVPLVIMLLTAFFVQITSVAVVKAQGGQVILKPTDDTYISPLNNPTANYGSSQRLRVSLVYYLTWLKFDLSTIPKGAVGISALLELCTTYDGVASPHFVVACIILPLNNSWSEATLTGDNFLWGEDVELDSDYVANNEIWYEWNVTQAVVNATTSNATDVTIIMTYPHPEEAVSIAFNSKEASSTKAPKLTVSWTDAIPEFPPILILPSFMIATLVAVLIMKRKHDVKA